MKKRRFQIYEYVGDGLYWRTVCNHSNGKKDTTYNEKEARAYCDELKQKGKKFFVEELIRVTDEFM